jgi:hypothetical protein
LFSITISTTITTTSSSSKNDHAEKSFNVELCLISNLPLTCNFVELKCGHKFNYGPLYKDIFNHKRKFNNMEQIKTKLKQNQIRCPYCRNVQDELLPYYDNFGYPKEHGINFYDANKSNYVDYYIDSNNQCQFQIVDMTSTVNTNIQQCKHYGYVHSSLKSKYNNCNKYCYTHKLAIVQEIKANEKKEKMKKLEEKTKLKMALLQQKTDVKNLKTEYKKSLLNSGVGENSNLDINIDFCKAILKTGKFKGIQCLMEIYKDCLCKRHFNLISKESDENIVIG